MSREIKFRAWVKSTNRMVDLQKVTPFALNDSRLKGLFLPFDNDYILMQCTGLKDKNGKEIYEGDIVVLDTFPEWGFRNARGCVEYVGSGFYVDTWPISRRPDNKREVIGNIYENPELLEQ